MLARAILATVLGAAAALADPSPLVSGDPLACFNRIDRAGTLTTVAVSGMSFTRALHVKTGAVPATANPWDIRPRCFSTLAARQNDVVAATFWMRTISAPAGLGLTSFFLERNDSPYTKSVTYTVAAGSDWKLVEVPFTMAETYAANAYNFSFWVTFPNQEIEIGGISILDYGPGIPFSQLGLSTWPYAERAADAPWRAGAAVQVRMNSHAFGFGTAVAGDIRATKTYPLTLTSNTEPAFVNIGKAVVGAIAPNGVVNAASFQGGALAPGEIVTIFGSGFGPATLAAAQYTDGQLPTSVGETRVLFDGTAAPMIYSAAGQVSAIVPYSVSGTVQVQIEYQGAATAPIAVPVAAAAPGIFTCPNKPTVALVINASAGGVLSCNDDFVPPAPGSVVTFYLTGDGVPTPPIADGRLPAGPPYPAPTAWTVNVGGVDAPRCAATFAGLVYAGVTQVNACIPDGVPQAASVPLIFRSGDASSAAVSIEVQPWKLVWSDEFNGPAGAPVDRTSWDFDLGGGGWGNSELEVYTNSTDNVFQDGAGNLVIRALRTGANTYTSARIKTQGRVNFQYGKIEARIKIPYGQGLWPAFWMLGNDINTAGWPACGEIDIMENIGKEPGIIHGTVHGPGYSGGNGIGGPDSLAAGKRFADDFHVYGVEWSPQSVAFFVDGSQYFAVTPASLPAGKTWVYQHPFFLILNVAVGGTWPGNPDATSTFPQQMLVDWVRVSQRQ